MNISNNQEKLKDCCLNDKISINDNSFIPMLQECERFIKFMNSRFNLNLPNDLVITIHKSRKSNIGYFMPKEHPEHFKNTIKELNNINLNTIYLKKNNPYEVLTHELSHYVNYLNGIKDCSKSQYHNNKFKIQAEKFYLSVEKTKKGYNQTKETEQFNKLLEEFKPNKEVFNICQLEQENKPKGSRLRLYICGCGIKVRVASDNFKAKCLICQEEFKKND